MKGVFTERWYRIDFYTLPTENGIFLPNKGHLLFPPQLIISQKTTDFFGIFIATLKTTLKSEYFEKKMSPVA